MIRERVLIFGPFLVILCAILMEACYFILRITTGIRTTPPTTSPCR